MVRKSDLSPIGYKKVAKRDDKEVVFGEIAKAYEYQPGEYVMISDEELDQANAERTKSIEIEQFASEKEIDIRYYEKPYYLEPDRNAEKPYALLREALAKSKKLAIARIILRNRQHLAVIKPVGEALVLNQMRFPADIRSAADLKLPKSSMVKTDEVKLASKLVDQLTGPFIAEDFHDTYTEQLEAVIEAKIKGVKPKAKPKASQTDTADLMASLKASLEQTKTKA